MFSDWNIFKHDLPRGHTDSQGWARPEVVRGGAEQRCACLAALGGKTWEPCLCFGASIAGGGGGGGAPPEKTLRFLSPEINFVSRKWCG